MVCPACVSAQYVGVEVCRHDAQRSQWLSLVRCNAFELEDQQASAQQE